MIFTIKGKNALNKSVKVEIKIISRKDLCSDDYWDVNWLDVNINAKLPGYKVDFDADLRTDEIRDFVNDLQSLSNDLKGKAILKNIDNYLYIECEMNNLGQLQWACETLYPTFHGALLNFTFQSDQSYLDELIKELNDIMLVFPVIQ